MNDEIDIKIIKFTKFQFNFEYETQHTGSTYRHFDVRINPTLANKWQMSVSAHNFSAKRLTAKLINKWKYFGLCETMKYSV